MSSFWVGFGAKWLIWLGWAACDWGTGGCIVEPGWELSSFGWLLMSGPGSLGLAARQGWSLAPRMGSFGGERFCEDAGTPCIGYRRDVVACNLLKLKVQV